MDPEKLREDLFFLTGFILTSMQGLYHEPAEYGIYRLLDVGGRLLSIIEMHGLSDDFLRKMGQEIEAEKARCMDEDRQKATISRLASEYAAELQRRLGSVNH
jgi:hypothetical protein